jgi:hypothetical protein
MVVMVVDSMAVMAAVSLGFQSNRWLEVFQCTMHNSSLSHHWSMGHGQQYRHNLCIDLCNLHVASALV